MRAESVMFTGSRGIPQPTAYDCVKQCVAYLNGRGIVVRHVYVGGDDHKNSLDEVDANVYKWAMVHEINRTVIPAKWRTSGKGKAAGPDRNQEMANFARGDGCRICVAIWDGKSRGTLNTIKLAAERGMNLVVLKYPERRIYEDPKFIYKDMPDVDFHFGDNISDIHAERVVIDFDNYPPPKEYRYGLIHCKLPERTRP